MPASKDKTSRNAKSRAKTGGKTAGKDMEKISNHFSPSQTGEAKKGESGNFPDLTEEELEELAMQEAFDEFNKENPWTNVVYKGGSRKKPCEEEKSEERATSSRKELFQVVSSPELLVPTTESENDKHIPTENDFPRLGQDPTPPKGRGSKGGWRVKGGKGGKKLQVVLGHISAEELEDEIANKLSPPRASLLSTVVVEEDEEETEEPNIVLLGEESNLVLLGEKQQPPPTQQRPDLFCHVCGIGNGKELDGTILYLQHACVHCGLYVHVPMWGCSKHTGVEGNYACNICTLPDVDQAPEKHQNDRAHTTNDPRTPLQHAENAEQPTLSNNDKANVTVNTETDELEETKEGESSKEGGGKEEVESEIDREERREGDSERKEQLVKHQHLRLQQLASQKQIQHTPPQQHHQQQPAQRPPHQQQSEQGQAQQNQQQQGQQPAANPQLMTAQQQSMDQPPAALYQLPPQLGQHSIQLPHHEIRAMQRQLHQQQLQQQPHQQHLLQPHQMPSGGQFSTVPQVLPISPTNTLRISKRTRGCLLRAMPPLPRNPAPVSKRDMTTSTSISSNSSSTGAAGRTCLALEG